MTDIIKRATQALDGYSSDEIEADERLMFAKATVRFAAEVQRLRAELTRRDEADRINEGRTA